MLLVGCPTCSRPSFYMSTDRADRLTVPEAAEALGISQDAVYKRVERNKIRYERDQDGRLYVYVDPSTTSRSKSSDNQTDRYIVSLEDQVEYLRGQLEAERGASAELRRIVAGLVQRVPELEPPTDERGSPETASEEPDKGAPPPPTGEERRSWWRRLFGP